MKISYSKTKIDWANEILNINIKVFSHGSLESFALHFNSNIGVNL